MGGEHCAQGLVAEADHLDQPGICHGPARPAIHGMGAVGPHGKRLAIADGAGEEAKPLGVAHVDVHEVQAATAARDMHIEGPGALHAGALHPLLQGPVIPRGADLGCRERRGPSAPGGLVGHRIEDVAGPPWAPGPVGRIDHDEVIPLGQGPHLPERGNRPSCRGDRDLSAAFLRRRGRAQKIGALACRDLTPAPRTAEMEGPLLTVFIYAACLLSPLVFHA